MSEKKKAPLWVKIVVPLLIVAAIGGVWVLKQSTGNKTVLSVEDWPDLYVQERFELEELLSYGVPVFLQFGSETCGPCKAMEPYLQEVYESTIGEAIVLYIDVDVQSWIIYEYPVMVTPTQVLYAADGTPLDADEDTLTALALTQYERKDTGEHVFTVHQGFMTTEQMMELLAEMGLAV